MSLRSIPLASPRALIALALWGMAAMTVWIVLAGERAPEETAQRVDAVLAFGKSAGIGAVLVAGLALLAWPPFLPGLRLGLKRMRDRMSVDQRPLLEANARLAHFDNAADHLTAGRTWLRMGKARQALPHLLRAVELDAASPIAHFLTGQALLSLAQIGPAIERLGAAVQLDPAHGFGEAMLTLAKALRIARDDASAEKVLAAHEARFGPCRRSDLMRARIALAQNDREAAARFAARGARPIETGFGTVAEESLARAHARVLSMRLGAPKT